MPRLALHPSLAVADLLRKRRHEMGLTLRQVQEDSKAVGELIPFSTLARVEQGKIDPGVRRLHVLLKLYNLPVQLAGDLLELELLARDHPGEQDLKSLYEAGVRHWQQGHVRQALGCLFALRQKTPADAESRSLRQKALLAFAVVAGSLGKYYLAQQIVNGLLLEPLAPEILIPTLIQAAHCWKGLGSSEAAMAFLLGAESHLAGAGDQERAWVFHEKASVLIGDGVFEEARTCLERALDCYAKAGDPYGRGKALVTQARLHFHQEDGPGALTAAQTAAQHAARHGLTRLALDAGIEEARARLLLGEVDSAMSVLTRILADAVSGEDTAVQFYAHYYLWQANNRQGDRPRAQMHRSVAQYFVRFVDELTPEAREVRSFAREGRPTIGRPRKGSVRKI